MLRLCVAENLLGIHSPVKFSHASSLLSFCCRFINSTLQFLPSLILYGLLQSIANTSNPIWEDYVLAVALGLSIILRVLVENAYFHKVMRVGFQLRSCLSTAIYRKSLRMSPTARAEVPVGKIVNLMQLDTGRLEALMMQLCVVVDAPYQIVGYMAILGYFLGWAALAGLARYVIVFSSTPCSREDWLQRRPAFQRNIVASQLRPINGCCCASYPRSPSSSNLLNHLNHLQHAPAGALPRLGYGCHGPPPRRCEQGN